MSELDLKLSHLPRRPGVYLMKDAQGRILYVGKASRLDHRVRSYFQASGTDHPRQAAFVPRVRDVDVIVTDSDVEALLLEMTLIKEKRPPYNIRLRDDKRYPYLKVTLGEAYPKTLITRRTPRDGSRYFGPFTDAGALRRTVKMVRTLFPIRSCMGTRPGRGVLYRECLDYHIHRCAAPCIDKISPEDYRLLVDRFVLFMAGKGEEVLAGLREEMARAAEALQFERAALLRDRIQGVERLMRRQKMHDAEERDLDVFAFARDAGNAYGVVLQVRGGTVLGKERRRLRGADGRPEDEIMAAFLAQFYRDRDGVPKEIAVGIVPRDCDLLERWLTGKAERAVSIRVPQRGRLAGLVRLAEENARLDFESARGVRVPGGVHPGVYALQKALGLPAPPLHIEGVDISNLQSTHPVASVVVFRNGEPEKSAYRRLTMRGAQAPNDVAMIAEAVGRRAARMAAGEFPEPDLFLIDGGPGQVQAAVTALEQEGLSGVPVVGLAKREETLVFPGNREPLRLSRTHPGLRVLIQVRDEAHRFAVSFHRARRAKAGLASDLDGLPGVGERRKLLLLHAFGSLSGLERATEEEIAAVPGLGPKVARTIMEFLHDRQESAGAA
jgi:excinuclease ABC subunit C